MTSQEEKESQPSLQTSRGKGGKGLGKGKAAEWAAGREERERHQAAIEAGAEFVVSPICLPELTLTPLEWVNASADLGQGRIKVSQFLLKNLLRGES